MTMADQSSSNLSSASMPQEEPQDRSAAGIQWQHYQMGLKASGANLGIGRRTVPDPRQQFSMSGSQFGNSSSAKSLYGSPE